MRRPGSRGTFENPQIVSVSRCRIPPPRAARRARTSQKGGFCPRGGDYCRRPDPQRTPTVQRTAASFRRLEQRHPPPADPSRDWPASRSGHRLINRNHCSCGACADIGSRRKPLRFPSTTGRPIGAFRSRLWARHGQWSGTILGTEAFLQVRASRILSVLHAVRWPRG